MEVGARDIVMKESGTTIISLKEFLDKNGKEKFHDQLVSSKYQNSGGTLHICSG